jgi:CRISPR/Cas system-associated protein Csm6
MIDGDRIVGHKRRPGLGRARAQKQSDGDRKARTAFLKKSSKKLLIKAAAAYPDRASANAQKFFAAFFQKQRRLPYPSVGLASAAARR